MNEEIWDWTKLDKYACEIRGHWSMERHLTSKEPSEALAFGIGFHKAREVWIQKRRVGWSDAMAIDEAKKAFLEVWEKELPFELREALEINNDRRSYGNFCRIFDAYVKKFPLAMFDKILAVEMPFTLYLGKTPKGREISWSGILDLAVEWQGGLFYDDLKTSSFAIDEKFFNQFRNSGQLIGYAWAGRELGIGNFSGVMIHGVEVKVPQEGMKLKKDGTPYARQGRQIEDMMGVDIINISDDMIEKWKKSTLKKIDQVMEAREEKSWTRNDGELCNSYNRDCPFKFLCTSPEDLIESRVQEFYKTREWNPLERM